ncbi:hypothetical protein HZC33_00910 [Candidatus Wolfebacteria bacterium]|nr:hypothetical protein [Candidatus Wolfebacteria bacterium]
MNKIIFIIAVVILIALISWAGIFYWQKYYKVSVQPVPEAPKAPETLGEQISGQTITNPADTIPQTNPYEAKTNPFESVKTNPYSDVYTNPFAK